MLHKEKSPVAEDRVGSSSGRVASELRAVGRVEEGVIVSVVVEALLLKERLSARYMAVWFIKRPFFLSLAEYLPG